MKTAIANTLLILIFSIPLLGQRGEWREKVESQKVAFITQKLDLSPEESQKFWPLYNEHQEAKDKILEGKTFRGEAAEDLTEEEALERIDNRLQTKYEMQQLDADYTRRYLDVLPAKKVLALEQAEQEFRKEILLRIQKRRSGNEGPPMRRNRRN